MTESHSRPEGCKAGLVDDLMVCERCGLQWIAGLPAPACDPITFEKLRDRMLMDVTSAEVSLRLTTELQREGRPADPRSSRRLLAERNALLRMMDAIVADRVIKERLNGRK